MSVGDIKFFAVYGDEKRVVEIGHPLGAGEQYHIYIDRYFYGSLVRNKGEWKLNSNKPELLTIDDIQIMGVMIDEEGAAYNKKSGNDAGF